MKEVFDLTPAWDEILAVHEEFSRVCRENDLRYYVAYGTALGAIRHSGFIPWDDDFDVVMPRDDYERLRALPKSVFHQDYKFIDVYNTKSLLLTFGKLQLIDKERVKCVEAKSHRRIPQGIYIDIFPMDGVPEWRIVRWWYKGVLWLLRMADSSLGGVFEKINPRSIFFRSIGWVVRKFVCIRSRNDAYRAYIAISKRCRYGSTSLAGCVNSPYGVYRDIMPLEYYGSPIKVPFCNTEVPVPRNFDGYLKRIYGDYMTPPPEEKRVVSHASQPEAPWKFGAED